MQRAHAAELGFYVAGYYGEAKFDGVDKARFDDYATFVYSVYGFTPEQTVSTLGDDKDASFGMAAGYRLFPNLAIEGGYVDLGELSYRNDSFGTHIDHQEPWFQKLGVSASGIALSALGVLPLSYRWELYARGGVLFATNEVDIYITDFFGEDALHCVGEQHRTARRRRRVVLIRRGLQRAVRVSARIRRRRRSVRGRHRHHVDRLHRVLLRERVDR